MSTILACNWKMNLGPRAAQDFVNSCVAPLSQNLKKTKLWIAPPTLSISATMSALNGNSTVKVGAQNAHWADNGAFTGESSAPMLREVGVSFAIVGHSERRNIFGESDELCVKRSIGLLAHNLTVVFCVGEMLDARESGKTMSVIDKQLSPLIEALATARYDHQACELILAYEPVWAIGTGKVASPTQVAETTNSIQNLWKQKSQLNLPPILYGGSVDPSNAGDLLKISSVAGFLVGGASIHPEKLPALVNICESSVRA